MSLIAWYPLIGDTKNQGTLGDELNPTASNIVYDSGKIGSALYKGVLTLSEDQWKKIIGNTISIAMWIYTREDGTFSAGIPFFGNGGMTKPKNRKFSMFHYPNRTTLHCSWQSDEDDSTYWGCTYQNFFELNKWIHLCIVQDAATKTITVYRNGTIYSTTPVERIPSLKFNAAAAAPIRSNIDYQHTNDLRIYDHALSALEVKELSSALVVHYPFNDLLIEGTTNASVINNWSNYSTYWTVIETTNSGWKFKKTSMSSSSTLAISNATIFNQMAVGDIWTISCLIYKNGEPFKSPSTIITNYLGTTPTLSYTSSENGYFSCTFRIDKKTNAYPIHAPIFGGTDTFTADDIFEIRNLQVEKKSYPTPYTIGTRAAKLYNQTGLVQPTQFQNNVIVKDSASGTTSMFCTGNTIINTPVSGDISTGATISCWVKTPTYPAENAIVFADYNSKLAFGFYGTQNAIISCGGYSVGYISNIKASWADGWNHIVVIRDSAAAISCYLNGVKLTTTSSNNWSSSSGYSTIGGRYNGSYTTYSTCYVSDYRLYHTCLSENDIQDLYKAKAYVSEQHDVLTHEFIESSATAQVNENYTIEAIEFAENLPIGYTQLEYIQANEGPCIDTGYAWTSEQGMLVADMEIVTLGTGDSLFGNEEYINSGSTRNFTHILYSQNTTGTFYVYTGTGSVSTINLPLQKRMFLEYFTKSSKKVSIRLNGEFLLNQTGYAGSIQTKANAYTSSTASTNVGHIFLFANHNSSKGSSNSGTQFIASMKLYHCSLYDNDILVRDFVPCIRESDGAIGLYDIILKQFHANAGSGTFVAGPVVANDNASIYEAQTISGRNLIEG